MVLNWLLDHLEPFLVKPFFDQVPNKGFALLAAQVSLGPDCKNLGSEVPILMAADKPCPQLQTSLMRTDSLKKPSLTSMILDFGNNFDYSKLLDT